jgi:6-phosphogluconolactonase
MKEVEILRRLRGDVHIHSDAAAVAAAGVEEVVTAAARSIARRGRFRIALAGGSTPKVMYAALRKADVDWPKVEIYFGDERCVPPDHADSNYKMAKEALLEHVDIPGAQIHRMHGEDDPAGAAASYADVLPGEPLDLVLLGMGPDGHTASLFPGTAALAETFQTVVANYVDKLATWRLTMTYPVLSGARRVAIVTVGSEKADALAQAIDGPDGAVPISGVSPEGGALYLVDQAAAAKLRR